MMSASDGEGSHGKVDVARGCVNFIVYINHIQMRTRRGQKIRKFCDHHIGKLPYVNQGREIVLAQLDYYQGRLNK